MPRIVVLLNEETSFELTRFPAVLGRSPECDIQVDNAQVSRRHAQIHEQNGQYFVECLGAANRTALNGKLLELKERSAVPLQHNDRIKLGPVRLRFESEAAEPEPLAATSEGFELTDNSSATIMGSTAARGFGVFEVRPEEKLRGILKINQSLAGQVELSEIAPRILDVLFDIFPQADRGTIQIRLAGSERLVPVAQKRRAESDDESVRLSRTILMKVLDEKIGILSADAANDARFSASESISSLKLHSMMCVPMLDLQGRPFGVINLDTQNPMKRFTDEDLELLLAVARQAANAYENVRLLKSHLEKQKQDEEMKIARSVQKALLPEVLPEVPGWYFYASYDAAQAVGGDYYDCFMIGENKICVSFGDVAGKGVPGALIMSRISSVVQNTMSFTDDVATAISRINRHMCHNMVAGRFVTYTLAVVDLQTNRISMVNAGHYPPLVRRADGSVEEFAGGQIGIPIGIMDDYEYDVVERDIQPGDLFLLRTDGVDEAMAPDGALYTTEKVLEFVRKVMSDTSQLGRDLLTDVRKHANGRPQNDDIAIMTFGRLS
ncbi:MAG: SpoIIE family protein phosphatase [Planctomyces sp.]